MNPHRAPENATVEEGCAPAASTDEIQVEGASPATALLGARISSELPYTWTFWRFKHNKAIRWKNMHHFLQNIRYEHEFTQFCKTMERLSVLDAGHGYSLFKKGIHPSWDHAANIKGGSWHIMPKNQDKHTMEALWHEILIAMIRNFADYDGNLCGAMATVRVDKIRITVWTADCENRDAVLQIGQNLCTALKLDHSCFRYLSNRECKSKRGFVIEPLYRLRATH